jgi:hypothetical protein
MPYCAFMVTDREPEHHIWMLNGKSLRDPPRAQTRAQEGTAGRAHSSRQKEAAGWKEGRTTPRVTAISVIMNASSPERSMTDHPDFSVVVKNRGRPQSPWKWEIYRSGRESPVKQSEVYFSTVTEANRRR